MVILCDMIQKNLEFFNDNQNDFMSFYRAYGLACQFQKFNLKIPLDLEREKMTANALKRYYYGALDEALLWTKKVENESDKEWNNRVRDKYFELREKAFIFLQRRCREDLKIILEVLSITAEIKREAVVKGLDLPHTWLVRGEDFG